MLKKLTILFLCTCMIFMFVSCINSGISDRLQSTSDEWKNSKKYDAIDPKHVLSEVFLEYKDWLYYTNFQESTKLYRMKPDGSHKQVISKDEVSMLVTDGTWLYYTANVQINKMRIDGSEKTNLCNTNVWDLHLHGNWIFYLEGLRDNVGTIYKIKTDGTEKTKVCENVVKNFSIIGDWIVYENLGGVYKIKTNGKDKTFVCEGYYHYFEYGNSIYFYDWDGSLYRHDVFSGKIEKLKVNIPEYARYIKTDGKNVVYYDDDQMIIQPLDGSEKKTLLYSNCIVGEPKLIGDYIYFADGNGKGSTVYCRIKKDGSELKRPNNGDSQKVSKKYDAIDPKHVLSEVFLEYQDWFYYTDFQESTKLYRVKTDGSQKQCISEDEVSMLVTDGTWLYYTADDQLKKMRMDGSEKTKISDMDVRDLHLHDNWLFFTKVYSKKDDFTGGSNEIGTIYKMKKNGTEKIKVCDTVGENFSILGDWIIYRNLDDDCVYKMKTNGKDKTSLCKGNYHYFEQGNSIYFYNNRGGFLFQHDVSSGKTERLEVIIPDDIYLIHTDGKDVVYYENDQMIMQPLDGNEKKLLYNNIDNNCLNYGPKIIGNYICFAETLNSGQGDTIYYRMKKDGSECEKVSVKEFRGV